MHYGASKSQITAMDKALRRKTVILRDGNDYRFNTSLPHFPFVVASEKYLEVNGQPILKLLKRQRRLLIADEGAVEDILLHAKTCDELRQTLKSEAGYFSENKKCHRADGFGSVPVPWCGSFRDTTSRHIADTAAIASGGVEAAIMEDGDILEPIFSSDKEVKEYREAFARGLNISPRLMPYFSVLGVTTVVVLSKDALMTLFKAHVDVNNGRGFLGCTTFPIHPRELSKRDRQALIDKGHDITQIFWIIVLAYPRRYPENKVAERRAAFNDKSSRYYRLVRALHDASIAGHYNFEETFECKWRVMALIHNHLKIQGSARHAEVDAMFHPAAYCSSAMDCVIDIMLKFRLNWKQVIQLCVVTCLRNGQLLQDAYLKELSSGRVLGEDVNTIVQNNSNLYKLGELFFRTDPRCGSQPEKLKSTGE